jgi:uncharacterized membrane protein
MDRITFYLTLVASLGSGLIAGTFFVFSVAIMRALERIPPGVGMWGMQSINIYILNPIFLGVFLGTGVICAALSIIGVVRWHLPGSAWLIAGGMIYIVGSIGVTVIFNVPMNNELMVADPTQPEGHKLWSEYLTNWTFWNHIRTILSLLASGSLIMAMVSSR